jgi:hypothetical protein
VARRRFRRGSIRPEFCERAGKVSAQHHAGSVRLTGDGVACVTVTIVRPKGIVADSRRRNVDRDTISWWLTDCWLG